MSLRDDGARHGLPASDFVDFAVLLRLHLGMPIRRRRRAAPARCGGRWRGGRRRGGCRRRKRVGLEAGGSGLEGGGEVGRAAAVVSHGSVAVHNVWSGSAV